MTIKEIKKMLEDSGIAFILKQGFGHMDVHVSKKNIQRVETLFGKKRDAWGDITLVHLVNNINIHYTIYIHTI